MKQILIALFLLFFTNLAWAQKGVIQGKVLDEKGEAMIGATVMIAGTNNGTKTDLQGQFAFRNMNDGTYSLQFSYISYDKKTVSDIVVKNGQCEFLNISMTPGGKGLKEVVIRTQERIHQCTLGTTKKLEYHFRRYFGRNDETYARP
jgi:hypothetical protein